MTWFGWILVSLTVLSTLVTVSQVGRYPTPITPGIAVAVVVTNAFIIWGAVTVGTLG